MPQSALEQLAQGDIWDQAAAQGGPSNTPSPSQPSNSGSALEALANGDLWDQAAAYTDQKTPAVPAKPEPATPPVTKSMNPKLAVAMAQKDASPAAGVAAVLGGATLLAQPVADSAAAATVARALKPIATKYGIKALEGAGIGLGYQLYKDLHSIFGGK
jgi:hypothetical protein